MRLDTLDEKSASKSIRPGTALKPPQTITQSKGKALDFKKPEPKPKLLVHIEEMESKITDKPALKKIDDQIEAKK